VAGSASHVRRQSTVEHDPGRAADSGDAGKIDCALRTQRLYAGRHLADRFFDQWASNSAKVLAERIIPELAKPEIENAAEPPLKHDGSTNALIGIYRSLKR